MAKDVFEELKKAPPRDVFAALETEKRVKDAPVPQRSVYLADVDQTIQHPADMSYDQVNDAIQTDVYQRPRFNFYRDVVTPMTTGGPAALVGTAALRAGQESGGKAITEPAKAVVRGSEGIIGSVGSLSRWFGENLQRQAELNDVPDSLGGKIAASAIAWGDKHYKYWQEQQMSGFEAQDPEIFRGAYLSNPSWTRTLALVAEAIPSLATAATLTFATGSPLAGAAALGLSEASGEAVNALEAGESLDTANAVGATNAVLLTLLERFSLARAFKGAQGKPVTHIIKEMIEEGLPEGAQTAVTNIIAAVGYDKTRQWYEGVLESMIAGAGSGGILGAFTAGRGKQIDALTQELHKAGVTQADIDRAREGQQAVVIANADEIEAMLQREAAGVAETIELTPEAELADAQREQELETIDTLLAEEQAAGEDADPETIEVLQEMKRQRELEAPEAAVVTELKDIQEKINEFNAKGEPVPDSLVKRQEAILAALEPQPTQGAKIDKKAIRRAVGMEDTSRKRLVSEMQSLKADLRAQAKGARAGFRAGLAAGKAKIIQALQLGEMKRDEIVEYMNKVLPKSERGRFITMVRDAKSSTDLAKAFMRIDKAEAEFTRKTFIKDIKNQLKKAANSKNISVDMKLAIEKLGSLFDTAIPRAETLKRLKATEDFLRAEIAKGNDIEMPTYVLEELQRLHKMPLTELQTDGLYYLANNIRDAIEVGKLKLKSRQAAVELRKENTLTEIERGTENKAEYVRVEDGGITGKVTLSEKFKNAFRSLRNYNIRAGQAMMPMDHFFKALGQVYYEKIKKPMDFHWRNYRTAYAKVSEEVAEVMLRLNLDEENFSRIAVHMIAAQETGYEKLLNTFPKAQVDNVLATPLTKDEQEMANLFRKHLDEVRTPLAAFMARVHNKQLHEVAGYFPFRTDADKTQDMEYQDRIADSLRKNVDLRFTQQRTGAGDQKIRVDGLNIFLEHMDDVLYAVNLGEHIKLSQELAANQRFRNAAGDAGQELTREWLDLMARKGAAQGSHARGLTQFLHYIRHNTGRAALALNPSSVFIQGIALLDGAGLIGNWAFQGARDIWSPEWRAFVKKNSSALAQRIGDDPSYAEFNDDAVDKFVFAPTKWTDGKTATAVFIGAYQKYMSEHNLAVDFTNPNVDAILYAEAIVNQTQGGGLYKDLPLMITKGIGLGGYPAFAKTATQFQSPLFFKWANLTATGARAVRQGDYGLAAQIAFYNLTATAAELVMRHYVNAAVFATIAAVAGVGFEDEEEKNWLIEYFSTLMGNIPVVGNLISALSYDKLPAPSLQALVDVVESASNAWASEDPDKKAKWLQVMALQAAGVGLGVPLTFKTASIRKKIES